MIVAGCDVGSLTGKAVIIDDEAIVGCHVIPCAINPQDTARQVMKETIGKAGLRSIEDLSYIVGTGYGRIKINFANTNVSEITCHAKGAYWACPEIRTVIDIGGQDCKVIAIDEAGKVRDFLMNDKCAAGTGRFFEMMAKVLKLGLEGLSQVSLRSGNPATVTSQCSVFAESEVISLLNDGRDVADIAAGIQVAVANRINSLARRVGLIDYITITGGCAKNEGLIKALEEKLQKRVRRLPEDPQIVGALGAALIAREKASDMVAG